jgi:drug/metabolite transporter (DMT)-like permease
VRALLYTLALIAVTFWGASFAATKVALRQLAPATLVFMRTTIGMLVLAVVALASKSLRQKLPTRWSHLLILGFLGVAFHQWIQAQGLQTTSTTDTGWIIATIPIFVALLGWRILGERLTLLRIIGIGIATLGVILVISDGRVLGFIRRLPDQLGNAYILLSAVNWAVFTVVSKRWLFRDATSASPAETDSKLSFPQMIQAMLKLMLMGWIIMLPWVMGEEPLRSVQAATPAVLGALLFLGIACSGLAYIFWYAALTRLEATETSALLYFEPLVTQAVAWFFLGEALTVGIIIGGSAILVGVWIVGRR